MYLSINRFRYLVAWNTLRLCKTCNQKSDGPLKRYRTRRLAHAGGRKMAEGWSLWAWQDLVCCTGKKDDDEQMMRRLVNRKWSAPPQSAHRGTISTPSE